MNLLPREQETIHGTAWRLRQGELSCEDVLRACLDRIDARESSVRAWVVVDREGALAEARSRDSELRAGHDRGPLHGIPIGIKDIIDVQGLPTGCGSPCPSDRRAGADAPVVSLLRAAGAVILGKTVTTAYAWIDPPVTRNPWNLDRTPGGSSSGSAAAVASGMCLGAIGTQTGGSIIRPASFCGVAGMKPSFGHVPTQGILPFAPSLDHPGPIARCVADLRLLYECIRDPEHHVESAPDELRSFDDCPPRLGRLRGFFDTNAHSEMRSAMSGFLDRFVSHEGAVLAEIELEGFFENLLAWHRAIMASEASAVHGESLALRPEAYPLRISALLREGAAVDSSVLETARSARAPSIARMLAVLAGPDRLQALAAPSTMGPAPDLSTTGDPAFNSPWSYLGFPTVGIPIELSTESLPLAVQLIGAPGTDFMLLRVAEWCEQKTRDAQTESRMLRHG